MTPIICVEQGLMKRIWCYQVWEHWSNGTLSDIVDASFGGNYPRVEALRCIQIGLLCVQEVPSARPTMSSVVLMLNSNSTSIQVPSRPAYVIEGLNRSDTKSVLLHTPNELSITELDLRWRYSVNVCVHIYHAFSAECLYYLAIILRYTIDVCWGYGPRKTATLTHQD